MPPDSSLGLVDYALASLLRGGDRRTAGRRLLESGRTSGKDGHDGLVAGVGFRLCLGLELLDRGGLLFVGPRLFGA